MILVLLELWLFDVLSLFISIWYPSLFDGEFKKEVATMTKLQLTTQLIITKTTTHRYVPKELEPFG
jgi:hypothetical protein